MILYQYWFQSIGECSKPSDEERARQQRVERRNHRRAQQVDQPRMRKKIVCWVIERWIRELYALGMCCPCDNLRHISDLGPTSSNSARRSRIRSRIGYRTYLPYSPAKPRTPVIAFHSLRFAIHVARCYFKLCRLFHPSYPILLSFRPRSNDLYLP